jgi:hypothetical protein
MGPTKDRMADERNGRNESTLKGGNYSGDSVPRPLGFIALTPSQFRSSSLGLGLRTPAWSGPGAGAQLASQHWLILRSGRLKCIEKGNHSQRLNEKPIDVYGAFRHGGYRAEPPFDGSPTSRTVGESARGGHCYCDQRQR